MARILRKTSVFAQLVHRYGNSALSDELWRVWKQGRNLIFHYFPHNYKAISLSEAEALIDDMVTVMEKAIRESSVSVKML